MRISRSAEPDKAESPVDDVARGDWDRYGSRGNTGSDAKSAPNAPAPAAADRERAARGRPRPDDDLYVEYRYENGFTPNEESSSSARPRLTANVIGVAIVGLLAVGAAAYALLTGAPAPSPSRPPTATVIAEASPSASGLAARSPLIAHVGVVLDLPMDIAIADRDQQPDDGATVYLLGSSGGVSIDPGKGRVLKVYGGPAFAGGVRRAIVRDGLWVSTWPIGSPTCGPACWRESETYRIDIATGNVTKTLQGAYLMGADSAGVWVGSGAAVQRLDPSSGEVLFTTPWAGDAEPRLGCDSLWAYTPAQDGAKLAEIVPGSGVVLGQSKLPPDVTYGPTFVGSQCWMMSGGNGVSLVVTNMVLLNPDGTTVATRGFQKTILSMNREFWTYTDGTLQRFEPNSGVNYGYSYTLAQRPKNDDARLLFSAGNRLWMVDGRSLASFDMPTGASSSRFTN